MLLKEYEKHICRNRGSLFASIALEFWDCRKKYKRLRRTNNWTQDSTILDIWAWDTSSFSSYPYCCSALLLIYKESAGFFTFAFVLFPLSLQHMSHLRFRINPHPKSGLCPQSLFALPVFIRTQNLPFDLSDAASYQPPILHQSSGSVHQ